MIVGFYRAAIGGLPITEPGFGRKHQVMLAAADLFMKWAVPTQIQTKLGPISIDPLHDPERALAYYFDNYVRHNRLSPLGLLISSMAPVGSFVDVGANLGSYSYLARLHGLKSYAVEPEPRFAAFLARNAAVFGPVAQVALSSEPGELPLFYVPGNTGAQSLLASTDAVRSPNTVKVTTFSDLAASGAFGDPGEIRLVKVDVEGFEAEVVAGMTDFLQSCRPSIWCEVRGSGAKRAANSWREVTRMMEVAGYSCRTQFDPDGIVFDLLFEPSR